MKYKNSSRNIFFIVLFLFGFKYGSETNSTDLWNFTPLHEASSKARDDVCSLLLAYNADPFIKNCHLKMAIDLAQTIELKEKIICKLFESF